MTTRKTVPAAIDVDTFLNGVQAQPGQIVYREPARTVGTQPTQCDPDMWKTYQTGEALQYPLPVWAVDEMRLRLNRSARYLSRTHTDELDELKAQRFKVTMRVEDANGVLIGNGLPNHNPALAKLGRDTLVLLNFRLHAPMNRGMRARATTRRNRRSTSAK